MTTIRLLSLAMLSTALAAAQAIAFPADAGATDVTDFGAVGDGVTDDTEALRAAIQRSGLLYLPPGTYLVSEPLKVPPREGSAPARRILQGAGRGLTTIRLADNSPAFADAGEPVPVFQISWGVAQAFRNGLRDLAIDVGAGNPGAIGCAFMASNQGGMHRIDLRAGEGSGAIGVNLDVGDNGPLLLHDLTITGFDTGIRAKYGQSMTLEHIRIADATVGIESEHALLFTRGLDIAAREVALRSAWSSVTSLLDARFRDAPVAIEPDKGTVFVRDLDASGCGRAIAGGPEGPMVAEWTVRRHALFAGDGTGSLRLPVVETPQVPWDDPATWAAIDDTDAGEIELDGRRVPDWTEGLRAALASGAGTVYLPRDGVALHGEVSVPASCRRIIGCENEPAKRGELLLVIDEASDEPLVIERFDTIYASPRIVLRAPRPVVVSSMVAETITVEAGAGPLFIEDVCGRLLDLAPDTRCWARQLNLEYVRADRAHVENHGGSFWCLGWKNEGDATMVATTAGGATEIYAYVLANKATPSAEKPDMFRVDDGRLSLVLGEAVIRKQPYGVLCRARIDGREATLDADQTAKRSNDGSAIGLLVVGDRAD